VDNEWLGDPDRGTSIGARIRADRRMSAAIRGKMPGVISKSRSDD
jgi:hypothetical protein